jgi:cell division protein FtsB
MRPIVNLASKPFRNRRLFWLAILAIFGLSAYFGLYTIDQKVRLEGELVKQQETLNRLTPQLTKNAAPTTPISTLSITSDKNRELLAARELIERRAFSWSQLLNDIERHIPPNVRVLRIAVNKVKTKDPNAASGGSEDRTVALTLEVIGKSTTDITKMITEFERAGAFTVNPIEKKLIEGMSDVQFTLAVEYTPPLPRGLRSSSASITQIAENRK